MRKWEEWFFPQSRWSSHASGLYGVVQLNAFQNNGFVFVRCAPWVNIKPKSTHTHVIWSERERNNNTRYETYPSCIREKNKQHWSGRNWDTSLICVHLKREKFKVITKWNKKKNEIRNSTHSARIHTHTHLTRSHRNQTEKKRKRKL